MSQCKKNKGRVWRVFLICKGVGSEAVQPTLFFYDSLGEKRSHTKWQRPLFFGVHSIMMVKSAQPGVGWGWGVHAHPLSLYLPSRAKLWCTFQLSGQIHSSLGPLWCHNQNTCCNVARNLKYNKYSCSGKTLLPICRNFGCLLMYCLSRKAN